MKELNELSNEIYIEISVDGVIEEVEEDVSDLKSAVLYPEEETEEAEENFYDIF